MADIDVTIQAISVGGVTPSYTGSLSTGNTYKIRNNGRVLVHLKKSAAVDCTVTIDTPGTVGGHAIAQGTGTVVASTGDVLFGPFPPTIYNDGTGDVNLTFSDIDGLTIGAFRI